MSETRQTIVNDVTRLNPVPVRAIVTPVSVEQVVEVVRNTTYPLSVGGGHFSMGGQTASPGSLHLDMRRLNQVVWFSPDGKADPGAERRALVRHPEFVDPARARGQASCRPTPTSPWADR